MGYRFESAFGALEQSFISHIHNQYIHFSSSFKRVVLKAKASYTIQLSYRQTVKSPSHAINVCEW
jgi:hypothetical protein